MSEEKPVLTRVINNIGHISLNRPKALHALNLEMIEIMIEAMQDFAKDDNILGVIIDHHQGRGFCAGGDIAMLATSGASDKILARRFFYREYQLNHLMHEYKKPIFAFIDGITMGGGVGISVHGKYRIATQNTVFAMPETGIGLFPDVGGGWFLPRLKNHIGYWLGLTGARIKAHDCKIAKIVTHIIDAENLANIKQELCEVSLDLKPDFDKVLDKHNINAEAFILTDDNISKIEEHFSKSSLEEIFKSLEDSQDDWAKEQLKILNTKSPQTMVVTFKQLNAGKKCENFAQNMQMEYRIGSRVISLNDFQEGVRAIIFDKDNNPKWQPEDVKTVSCALIEAIFAPLEDEEWQPL